MWFDADRNVAGNPPAIEIDDGHGVFRKVFAYIGNTGRRRDDVLDAAADAFYGTDYLIAARIDDGQGRTRIYIDVLVRDEDPAPVSAVIDVMRAIAHRNRRHD